VNDSAEWLAARGLTVASNPGLSPRPDEDRPTWALALRNPSRLRIARAPECAEQTCKLREDAQAVLAPLRRQAEDAMVQNSCPHAGYECRGAEACGECVSGSGECGHDEPFPSGSVPWHATPRTGFDEPRPRLDLYVVTSIMPSVRQCLTYVAGAGVFSPRITQGVGRQEFVIPNAGPGSSGPTAITRPG
jgi:hypothetical protein